MFKHLNISNRCPQDLIINSKILLKEHKLTQQKFSCVELNKEIKCEDKGIQTYVDETLELKSKIIELISDISHKTEKISLLETENRNISKCNRDIIHKVNELKEKLTECEIKIEALEHAKRSLVNENNKLAHKNARLAKEISNFEKLISELNSKIQEIESLSKNPDFLINQIRQLAQNNKELMAMFINKIKENIIEDRSNQSDPSRSSMLAVAEVITPFGQRKKSSFSSQKQKKSRNSSEDEINKQDEEDNESIGNKLDVDLDEGNGKRLDIVNEERSDYDSRFFDEESKNRSRLNNLSKSSAKRKDRGTKNNSDDLNDSLKMSQWKRERGSSESLSSRKLVNIPSESASKFETEKSIQSITTESKNKNNLKKTFNTSNLTTMKMDINGNIRNSLQVSQPRDLKNLKTIKHDDAMKNLQNNSLDKRKTYFFSGPDSFKGFKRMTTSFMDMKVPHSEKCGPNCRHLRNGDGLHDHVPEGTYILKQKEHLFDL